MDEIARESSYATPYANSTILPMLLLSLAVQKHAPETKTSFKDEYDYIIVGAGSAGSTVASRLSEKGCVSILLLEAGKSPPRLTEIPAIARFFINSDIDWRYFTEPQKHSGDALINNQVTWPSGKAVGGSSIFNAMLYVRGNRKNYDDWAAGGATGWSYRDVLRYFKKMENNQNPESIDREFHGFDGPMTVENPRYNSTLRAAALDAVRSLGIPIVDSNGRRQPGSYDLQGTMRRGQRCSTAKAYLVPAENRTNLDILPNAHVTKVVIKSFGNILLRNHRATGVQFDYNGKRYEVKAKREVIMSAGTVNTAQILMLSGIGPKATLDKFQIPVVQDLPVGLNFQDHQASFMAYEVQQDAPFLGKLTDGTHIQNYIENKEGPLASAEGVANIVYLPMDRNANRSVQPDFNTYLIETALQGLLPTANIKQDVYDNFFRPHENKTMILCTSQILNPRSKGYVGLRSADPYDPPIIDPNFYENQQDVNEVVAGLKFCNDILKTEPMQRIGVRPIETRFPGCDQFDNEDQYLSCVAKALYITTNHQVGTAKMGNNLDRTTVVDPTLRVKNVRGLRVVDASVMPIIPSANTNVPTIMIAEKAADMIKSTFVCL